MNLLRKVLPLIQTFNNTGKQIIKYNEEFKIDKLIIYDKKENNKKLSCNLKYLLSKKISNLTYMDDFKNNKNIKTRISSPLNIKSKNEKYPQKIDIYKHTINNYKKVLTHTNLKSFINQSNFPLLHYSKQLEGRPNPTIFKSLNFEDDKMEKILSYLPLTSTVLNNTLPYSLQSSLKEWRKIIISKLGRNKFETFYRGKFTNTCNKI